MSVPTCKKCALSHFNFQSCEKAKAEQNGAGQPVAELRTDYGLIPFGNRLETFEERGGTLWLKTTERKVHRGNVIEPKEWHGKKEEAE